MSSTALCCEQTSKASLGALCCSHLTPQGQLAVLDVGADSPLHDLLLHEGTEPLRTLYEEDFGKPVADVLLLQQPRRRRRQLAAEQLRLRQLYASISAAGQNRKLITATQGQDLGVYVSY